MMDTSTFNPAGLENRSDASIKIFENPDRFPEKVVAELWQAAHDKSDPLNHGGGPIVDISLRCLPNQMDTFTFMAINETVQWLGTHEGLEFLQRFNKKLKERGFSGF